MPDIRMPTDFKAFLRNEANKEKPFQFIEEVWAENAPEIGDRVIYFEERINVES